MENNNKSPHILNTSANLLGLCFIVLTSLKIQNAREGTLIDEVTAIAIMIFMASSVLSFLSIRSKTEKGERYEEIADKIFISGLLMLSVITLLVTFNIVK
ncbi:MAG: hypothetical protein JNL70_28140 [Saprospiraceae bacterium]|nr:hypothetical protein [Saprospiraceae bacterium]